MDFLGLLDTKRLASKLGFGVEKANTSMNQGYEAIPRGFSYDNSRFSNSFEFLSNQQNEQTSSDRAFKLNAYTRMDSYSSICNLALNLYSNEALGISRDFMPSIKFRINDDNIQKKVQKCLDINGSIKNSKLRENIRSLCKYGDFAYVLSFDNDPNDVDEDGNQYLTESMSINEKILNKKNKLSKPLAPEDITIRYIDAKDYILRGFQDQVYKLLTNTQAPVEFQPWEFTLFSLESRNTFPYGESILEPARIPFEDTQVSEQLMKMSRMSNVERMIIKIPSGGDPISDFERFANIRSSLENVRFNNSAGNSTMTRNSDYGLKTVIYAPDNIKFEQIKPTINVSEIGDVEYFAKKEITALGLPRSYLLQDDTNTDIRGKALEEQDLVFARQLVPIQNAIVDGYQRLITLIAYYMGADLDKLKVNVKLYYPHRLNTSYLSQYEEGMRLLENQLALFKAWIPNYRPTAADLKYAIYKAGLDPQILNCGGVIKAAKNSGDDLDFNENPFSGAGNDFELETSENEGFNQEREEATQESVNRKYDLNSGNIIVESVTKDYSDYLMQIDESLIVHSKLYDCFINYRKY